MQFYKIIRPFLFLFNPEKIHNVAVFLGRVCGSNFLTRLKLKILFYYKNEKLQQDILGIRFNNPVGLAAGFDKECVLMKILPSLGFGFEEVGSITALPYEGNPKPRLKRLLKDNAIIVNYGLKNRGARFLKKRLFNKKFKIPIGVSIAKTNKPFKSDKEKILDWVKGVKIMKDTGDFLVINLSCPNICDPKTPQEPSFVRKLISELERIKIEKPLFLKLSADISLYYTDEIIEIAKKYDFVKGFILTNLAKNRNILKLKTSKEIYSKYSGGISGKPIQNLSDELIKYIYKKTKGRYVIIGCGGIFTAEDAYRKIKNGASLVQLVTGMIYEGPGVVKNINKGLVKLLEKDGYRNISEAVGKNVF